MAKGLLFSGGSPLINSPIIYKVTAETLSSQVNVAFHRLKIKVTAGLQGGDFHEMIMSSPVNDGETISIDISSALRAVADEYIYAVEPPEHYPYIVFSLSAWDEYMQNGELHKNVNITTNSGGKALMGGYSDLDRMLSNGSKQTLRFSRKPDTSPEILLNGEIYIRPKDMAVTIGNITEGPASVEYTISIDKDNPAGLRKLGGALVYVIEKTNVDRYQFRFINKLGCMESISVSSLATEKMNLTKEDYIMSLQENFDNFSRGYITKSNDYETLEMSSGPLDRMWQQWFLHEFLMARWVWVNINNNWIPCHIVPSDTIAGADRVNRNMYSVSFTVRLDINGSPYLTV